MEIEVIEFVQFARHDDQLMKLKMNAMSVAQIYHETVSVGPIGRRLGKGTLLRGPFGKDRMHL